MRGSDGTERVPEGKVSGVFGEGCEIFQNRRDGHDRSVKAKEAVLGAVLDSKDS